MARTEIINSIGLTRQEATPDFIDISFDRLSPTVSEFDDDDKFYLEKYVIDLDDTDKIDQIQYLLSSLTIVQYMESYNFMSIVFGMGLAGDNASNLGEPTFIDITDLITGGYAILVDNKADRTALYVYRVLSILDEGGQNFTEYATDYVYGIDTITTYPPGEDEETEITGFVLLRRRCGDGLPQGRIRCGWRRYPPPEKLPV